MGLALRDETETTYVTPKYYKTPAFYNLNVPVWCAEVEEAGLRIYSTHSGSYASVSDRDLVDGVRGFNMCLEDVGRDGRGRRCLRLFHNGL